MTELTTDRFAEFFTALHGQQPFPWQLRLAGLVTEAGWPAVIAMPTASGKTACIDVAVYAMAVEGFVPERRQPRRVFFVVDRRVVVDEAYERAKIIARALAGANSGILAEVAARLRLLAGDSVPLATAVLRGGIYRDDRWARSPAQPSVVVSTVDQVGSRLLFRGYGVSPSARPLHAALVGNDSLVIVDEAHCARPFAQTLGWFARYRSEKWAERPVPAPFRTVQMTATPPADVAPEDVFTASADDRCHEVLGRRLKSRKLAKLVVAKDKPADLVAALVTEASTLTPGRRAVGVVVNRVATARAVYAELTQRTQAKKPLAADLVLLTGRVRPIDRDALIAEIRDRVAARTDRGGPPARPLVVVATQCIEVGANFDFDALVTECAPLDSLRQRFGRLDRLGLAGEVPAAVVIQKAMAPAGAAELPEDRLYGTALSATWRWLDQHASGDSERCIDMGVTAIDALLAADPGSIADLSAPAPDAPVLLPAHCDCWVQTSPAPHADPEPAIFLHGPKAGAPDVQVVWRADIDAAVPQGCWAEIVAICPPSSSEAMSAPLHEVRAWLEGTVEPAGSDLEGTEVDEPTKPASPPGPARAVLRWYGPESSQTEVISEPGKLRPGDTLVVPAALGGCDRFGWSPESTEAVRDLGELTRHQRRRALLRLSSAVVAGWPVSGETRARLQALAAHREEGELPEEDIHEALVALAADSTGPSWLRQVATHLSRRAERRVSTHPSGVGLVIAGRHLMPGVDDPTDFTDDDNTASAGSAEVLLETHLAHVRDAVSGFGASLSLPELTLRDCLLAAELHDWGKADPRMQLWLHGADRAAMTASPGLLAKSRRLPTTPGALERTRCRSGYPRGGRHELLSVRLTQSEGKRLSSAADQDLVLHLIASHHGRCRPFVPVVVDDTPVSVTLPPQLGDGNASSATGLEQLDSGVAERFWTLVRRYGWWGLAWLESVVRLADHRASEREQEKQP